MNELTIQPFIRDRKTAIDSIREYVLDTRERVVLSETNREIFNRLKAAWVFMIDKSATKDETAEMLQDLYRISDVQAWRDVKNALNLFGEASRAEKEGEREILVQKIEKLRRLAMEKKDYKTAAECDKNIIKARGFDKKDPDLPDFAKLEQHIYIVVMPPAMLELLTKMVDQPGTVNLNKVEDIEFTDLSK